MVFPYVPIIKFPDLNQLFIIPIIAYAKLMSLCRPEWKRINGMYGIPFLLFVIFLVFYFLLWFVF